MATFSKYVVPSDIVEVSNNNGELSVEVSWNTKAQISSRTGLLQAAVKVTSWINVSTLLTTPEYKDRGSLAVHHFLSLNKRLGKSGEHLRTWFTHFTSSPQDVICHKKVEKDGHVRFVFISKTVFISSTLPIFIIFHLILFFQQIFRQPWAGQLMFLGN